jgi:hypothetical protein
LAFSYWFDKPRFLTEGKLVVVLIRPPLGVPNWSVIYINTAPQSIGKMSLWWTQWHLHLYAIWPGGVELSKSEPFPIFVKTQVFLSNFFDKKHLFYPSLPIKF